MKASTLEKIAEIGVIGSFVISFTGLIICARLGSIKMPQSIVIERELRRSVSSSHSIEDYLKSRRLQQRYEEIMRKPGMLEEERIFDSTVAKYMVGGTLMAAGGTISSFYCLAMLFRYIRKREEEQSNYSP